MSTSKIKMGRPKKYQDEPVSWGMRVTQEDREKIKELGKLYHRPASQVVMELVDKALLEIKMSAISPLTRRYSAKELRAMPREERAIILKEQAKIAMLDFEFIPDGFDIIDDECP